METAKVDVRKLQLLNDRISQCLDALNQVRLSVHGLSHTQATAPLGAAGQGAGYFDPRLTDPRISYGFAPNTPGYSGLSHSSFPQNPQIPIPGFGPYGMSGMTGANPLASQIPIWNAPFGLSHTGIESDPAFNRPLWSDPILAQRVVQTFPFAQLPLPPIVPVY